MRVLSTLEIQGRPNSRIELWQGDLTDLGPENAVDALLVSAFPDDYTPVPHTLIGALDAQSLSVGDLARDKDLDIRPTHSCWLSKQIAPSAQGLRFHRIIGFEPGVRGKPPELVGDIFRALEWMLAVRPEIRSVAMPIVAAGDARYPVATMLEPLLAAALPWLELGLGLDRLAIAAHSDTSADEALRVFETVSATYTKPVAPVTGTIDYDVFISYSHKNTEAATAFVSLLRELRPDVRVFVDRDALEVGMAWQDEIYGSLERSRYVVALLSPEYLESKNCQREFGMADLHGDRVNRRVLRPIYIFEAALPTRMVYVQYIDAREGDAIKMRAAASAIVGLLDRP